MVYDVYLSISLSLSLSVSLDPLRSNSMFHLVRLLLHALPAPADPKKAVTMFLPGRALLPVAKPTGSMQPRPEDSPAIKLGKRSHNTQEMAPKKGKRQLKRRKPTSRPAEWRVKIAQGTETRDNLLGPRCG